MINKRTRVETDTIGDIEIPYDALWGAQTERSRHNFPTGNFMPISIIRVLFQIKKAAAESNITLSAIDAKKGELIIKAIDTLLELSDTDLRKDFPLKIYQTGSGTQTNMNVNEVVAHQAGKLDSSIEVLPNDDVNKGQSSNDIFPTAMNIAASLEIQTLKKSLEHLIEELDLKVKKYWKTVKIGRTHLQDATPLTFGQEISGWKSALEHDLEYITRLEDTLLELPMGGTAVGTGLNASEGFADIIAEKMSSLYNLNFSAKNNKFYGLSHHSGISVVHGALKTLAADLMKIANDVRFLASGPRAGYGELNIPANEPGSSIMPGKVNPTQAEAVTMAAVRVIGNDVVVGMSASQGNFELNVYKPVMIDAFLESVNLLRGTMEGFADKMIHGLTVNEKRMRELCDNSLMTVTALSPHIGYHDSAVLAQEADKQDKNLREVAIRSGKVSEQEYDEWMNMLKMTNIDENLDSANC